MDEVVLSRDELYRRVWSKPMRENAADLGMSDVGLRKLCKREGIPIPPQGYWLMAEGPARDRLKDDLPPPGPGDRLGFRFRPGDKAVANSANEARETAMAALHAAEVKERDKAIAGRFVRIIRKGLDLRKKDERGILLPQGKSPVATRVSVAQLDRALLALERLIARFSSMGVAVEQHAEHAGLPTFDVGGQRYSFWIEEHAGRSERPLTQREMKEKREAEARNGYFYYADRWTFTPSGKLTLRLSHASYHYAYKSWADTAGAGIEDRVDAVVADTFSYAEKQRAEERAREIESRKRRARELWGLRQLRREHHQAQQVRALKRQARSWFRAQTLRSYVEAVAECEVSILPAFNSIEGKSAWLDWARSVVASMDPIANGSAGRLPARPPMSEIERLGRGFR